MDLSRLAQELEMTVSLKEARERELETKNQELQQGAFFNNQLYHDVVHFKEENGFLISKLKELEQVILQLEDHCSRSIKDIELHEDEKQGLRNSLEQLRLENSDIIRFCANEKQGYDQLVVSLKEELSRTRQKYGESEKELEKESGKIAALASDKLGLEAANHQLVLEKTKQDEYCQQLLKEVRSLTSINESLVSNAAPKAELQRLDKEIRHKDTRIT
jgi:chromosome segregation ATPase